MLYSFLLKGSFQDSVSLMLLSRSLSDYDDVNKVSVMMGTPANKDVFRETGLWCCRLTRPAEFWRQC